MLAWIVVLVIAWRGDPPGLLAGALLAAGFELLAFHETFIAPKGSTAALIYAVKPIWQVGLLLRGDRHRHAAALHSPPAVRTGGGRCTRRS